MIKCCLCSCGSGDLVGDDDIDSSPTFELIVEGEEAEVELESHSTASMTSEAAVVVTAFANKRMRIIDENDDDVAAAADCSASTVFVTGISNVCVVVVPSTVTYYNTIQYTQ